MHIDAFSLCKLGCIQFVLCVSVCTTHAFELGRQIQPRVDDLEASPFGQQFSAPAPPEGSVSLVDSELEPPVVWSFPLQVSLLSEGERQ